MAPRRRDNKNRHLEGTNIKKHIRGGKSYFYYIMPDGSQEPLVHGDEKASVEAAVALNQALRPAGNIVERVLAVKPSNQNPPIIEVIEQFKFEWLPQQKYSDRSFNERRLKLERWCREWPHFPIASLDTFKIAEFLRTLSAEASRQHRILLDQFFRFAASRGYQTARPMIDIERVKQQKRKRARHTWEGFKAIYDASPEWLQQAQDIAIYSLQRRSDLVSIRIDKDIDIKAKTMRILQQKTKNYDVPVFIDIEMGEELYAAVMASHWSGINCPFLIHHRGRVTAQSRSAKPHPFSVTANYLTNAYSKIRDKVGVYNHLDKIERPGIHSLRALGVWLYSKAGYDDNYIMALSGHASKRMKDRYHEGHEKPAPINVQAGLSLDKVDLAEIDWQTDLSVPLQEIVSGNE